MSWPSACRRTPPKRSISPRRRRRRSGSTASINPQTRRLRPAVPAGAPAGRARRPLHPALLRRRPQRRQLGRARRPRLQPHAPRRPHRQADRGPAQGPEAARPARRDADRLGRRVRPATDRGIRARHRPRSQRLRLHDVDGRRRQSRAAAASARPTSSAPPRSRSRFHVKHLHATILALMGLDPDRLTYFYGGLDQKLVGVEGAEPIRADHGVAPCFCVRVSPAVGGKRTQHQPIGLTGFSNPAKYSGASLPIIAIVPPNRAAAPCRQRQEAQAA